MVGAAGADDVTLAAIAAINAGAFYDNGTSSSVVGSVPEGLVIAGGEVLWTSGQAPENGFAGFNEDNVLVVARTMTAAKAKELKINDDHGAACWHNIKDAIAEGRLTKEEVEEMYNNEQ